MPWLPVAYALLVLAVAVFVAVSLALHDQSEGANFAPIWLMLVTLPWSVIQATLARPGGPGGGAFFLYTSVLIGAVLNTTLLYRLSLAANERSASNDEMAAPTDAVRPATDSRPRREFGFLLLAIGGFIFGSVVGGTVGLGAVAVLIVAVTAAVLVLAVRRASTSGRAAGWRVFAVAAAIGFGIVAFQVSSPDPVLPPPPTPGHPSTSDLSRIPPSIRDDPPVAPPRSVR